MSKEKENKNNESKLDDKVELESEQEKNKLPESKKLDEEKSKSVDVKKNIFGKKEKKKSEAELLRIANDELTNLVKRTQAEFINFKNRTEREAKDIINYSCSGTIRKLLPVIDTFEIALKNAPETDFKKGMEMVYTQLLDVLKSEGVTPIICVGKKFDHNFHEVMLKEKSDKDDDIILEEFQKGYMLKDRVLRHSKVKISG